MFKHTLTLIDQELSGTISPEDRDELMEQMMMEPAIADELNRRERLLYHNLNADAQDLKANSRPKWQLLSHAASVIVGAGVVLVLSQGVDDVVTPGLASANVYELDNVRSATRLIRPVRIKKGEDWVTFMTYLSDPEFVRLDSRIEIYSGDPEKVLSALDSSWRTVWQSDSSVGGGDTLVLNLPADVLVPGIHRLAIHGIADGVSTTRSIHEVLFDLQYQDKQ